MDFSTKLAQTRTYTTENQLGVDSQEVYNEAILQAVELTNPTMSNPQNIEVYNLGPDTYNFSGYYSISLTFSSDFTGTLQGASIEPNTIINLSAKTQLSAIDFTVITGTILFVAILN